MRYLLALALLAGCSGSPTAPVTTTTNTAKDPSVLIINQTVRDTVIFTWRNGQGIAGTDAVLPGVTTCERFTAQADSAAWRAVVRDWPYGPNNPPDSSTAASATYFNPTTHPAWRLTVTQNQGGASPGVLQQIDNIMC